MLAVFYRKCMLFLRANPFCIVPAMLKRMMREKRLMLLGISL
jgi:hypothetical protein